MPKRDKTIDPQEGIKRNTQLEMPLEVGDKKKAVPGSLPPKKERKKKEGKLQFDDLETKKAEEEQELADDPFGDKDRVEKWAEENIVPEEAEEENFSMTKKELLDLIKNPLGMLCAGNEKDAEFVHAYMQIGNVQDALKYCEYAPKRILQNRTALVTLAREMMNRPEIQAAVSWVKSQRVDDLIVSRDEWADYLSQIIRGDIGNMIDDEGLLIPSKIKQHGRCIETYSSKVDKKGNLHVSVKMRNPQAAAKELKEYEDWQSKGKVGVGEGGNLADDAIEAINSEVIEAVVEEDEEPDTNTSKV